MPWGYGDKRFGFGFYSLCDHWRTVKFPLVAYSPNKSWSGSQFDGVVPADFYPPKNYEVRSSISDQIGDGIDLGEAQNLHFRYTKFRELF